ncbi:hypothetical protein JHK85_001766 [Glycine max]|uniref:Uncharacterized protein n=1 Tax=Glycine max TaxID=3847 RepID=A0A0R0LAX6_SOYBN|nr:hypothetical protein JHK87_001709 [Glycine soja]KAG5069389.1 hypothetical protein JHK85_001766 [Glycine max]KAG5089112.1 hypothetical protein JHK86_001724 [Glycine max]KAH1163012.1 hypothetical protein GYH30_001511 [Glycine max]
MHQPGIEPGSVPWQGTILPLDHWCHLKILEQKINKNNSFHQSIYTTTSASALKSAKSFPTKSR